MTKPRKKQPLGQTIGGILFGFEQQVLRTMPPPQELVHHARPDDPMPAGDGGFVTIEMPDDRESVGSTDSGPAAADALAEPLPEPGDEEP